MNRMRSTVLICLAAVACGDASGPSPPNLRGTYDLTFRFVQTDVTTNQAQTALCAGSMTITSQSGATFSGTFATIATPVTPCSNVGGTVSGQVQPDGRLAFHMMRPNQPNEVAWITGCSIRSGNGDEFIGLFSVDRIIATLSAGIRCPAPNNAFDDYSFQAHVTAVQL